MNRPSNLTRTRSLRLPRLSSRNSSSNGSKSEGMYSKTFNESPHMVIFKMSQLKSFIPLFSFNHQFSSIVDCSLNTSIELDTDPRIAELELKLKASEKKIKEMESESKEMKENVEFLTTERTVLLESLKESEENLLKERLVWIKALEEVKVWSKRIYEKLKEKW